jgi:murein DD-endopeptidase MepM/ murein hydrolase activator NlpD
VIPESGGRAVSFTLPQLLVVLSAIFLAVILLLLGVLVKGAVEKGVNGSAARLRGTENRMVRAKVEEFDKELDMIFARVETLKVMSQRARSLSQVKLLEQDRSSAPREVERNVGPGSDDEITAKLADLLVQTRSEKASLDALVESIRGQKTILERTPSIRPAAGWLIAGYGYTRNPFTGRTEMHKGVDIAALEGTPIHATADGNVSFVGHKPGYGLTVVIDHGRGLSTWYAHCSMCRVRTGEFVKRGSVIATIGKTGQAIGPHVQYEIRVNGEPVDPEGFFLDALPPRS